MVVYLFSPPLSFMWEGVWFSFCLGVWFEVTVGLVVNGPWRSLHCMRCYHVERPDGSCWMPLCGALWRSGPRAINQKLPPVTEPWEREQSGPQPIVGSNWSIRSSHLQSVIKAMMLISFQLEKESCRVRPPVWFFCLSAKSAFHSFKTLQRNWRVNCIL